MCMRTKDPLTMLGGCFGLRNWVLWAAAGLEGAHDHGGIHPCTSPVLPTAPPGWSVLMGRRETEARQWQATSRVSHKQQVSIAFLSPFSITDSMNMSLSKLWEIEGWSAAVCGVAKSQTRLSD